jgi:hypothetical protein
VKAEVTILSDWRARRSPAGGAPAYGCRARGVLMPAPWCAVLVPWSHPFDTKLALPVRGLCQAQPHGQKSKAKKPHDSLLFLPAWVRQLPCAQWSPIPPGYTQRADTRILRWQLSRRTVPV